VPRQQVRPLRLELAKRGQTLVARLNH
jgi:hypothetical protein